MAGKRWLRLDVAWEDSEWLDDIDGTASGSWPRILSLVKRDGVGGRCKRPSLKVMARKWRVPVESIKELEEAAVKDGALVVDGGDWIVVKWEEYQGADSTAAARKKRQRDRESQASRSVTRDNRDRGRDLSRATETETETSTTNTQNARGGEAGVGTANGRGYDARALKVLERWNELDLALPATVSEHDHMRRLTLLFTGPPKAWKTTEIFAAMQKLKDAPDEWGWVLSEGPGYLAHQPRGKRQVIEQVLTKTRGGRSGRETADARADRLMAEMEADDARTG